MAQLAGGDRARIATFVAILAGIATILSFFMPEAQRCRFLHVACPTIEPPPPKRPISLAAARPSAATPETLPKVAAPGATAIEMEYWHSISESGDIELYKEYLRRYPNGEFADIARFKLRHLEEAAVKPPPVATPAPSIAAPSPVVPDELSKLTGFWQGHYYCAQGLTLVSIDIWRNQYGTFGSFSFEPPPGGRGSSGSYEMRIEQGESEIVLQPINWIVRPRGYEMVPASVRLVGGDRLYGRILSGGCGEIDISRPQ